MKSIDDGTDCRVPAAIHDPAIPGGIGDEIGDEIGQALNCRKLERRT